MPVISKVWPGMRVTWITRAESIQLLANNPYITEILPYGTDALVHLAARTFDKVINLDAGRISAALASMANAKEKIGYIVSDEGYVIGTNPAAEVWLKMGVFDDLKKANQRTYQEIMCSIAGLPTDGIRYVFELTEEEINNGRDQLQKMGVDLEKNIIGIFTGGGGRWVQKQWIEERFIDLILNLKQELGQSAVILLIGGPQEKEQNQRISSRVQGRAVDVGCDNTVRHVASLIRSCTVLLSGDSLPMHVALSMGRRVVVLFGPTSHSEIELFGLGEKVFADLDCLVCYKQVCDCKPNCMELITVDMVKQAILRQLSLS
ncbi:glycosyltransferase family 9 protein [bacterium]|nr:glycosyltransferase family 9 protein [bacterium]